MLFAYRYTKTDLEDLHEAICKFMRKLRYGTINPGPFDAGNCCSGELLARARASVNLQQFLKNFYDAWFILQMADRQTVYTAFIRMNRVHGLLDATVGRMIVSDLPEAIRQPTRDLFAHLYERSLTDAKKRAHWEEIYGSLPVKICPFCGIESLHHPQLYKQDYDHLLARGTYPFAAVNARNLVPSGRDCNTIFKHDADLIYGAAGRRRAFDPFRAYGHTIDVNLHGSQLPDTGADPGQWEITFAPDIEEVRTWIDVFDLRRRYELEIFGEYYDRWRQDFADWLAPQAVPCPAALWTATAVKNAMGDYVLLLDDDRLRDMRFLKRALFQFLLAEAEEVFFAALADQINDRT